MCMLAGSGPALVHHPARERLEDRRGVGERRLVGTDHDRQTRLPGADIAAAHWRIDRRDAALGSAAVDLDRCVVRAGRTGEGTLTGKDV